MFTHVSGDGNNPMSIQILLGKKAVMHQISEKLKRTTIPETLILP